MRHDVARWRHVAVIGGYICYRLFMRDPWTMKRLAPAGRRETAKARMSLAEWVMERREKLGLNRFGGKKRTRSQYASDRREEALSNGKCGRCFKRKAERGKTMCSKCLEYMKSRAYAIYHGEEKD